MVNTPPSDRSVNPPQASSDLPSPETPPQGNHKATLPLLLLVLSTVLLSIGLFAPCFTVVPRFGTFTTAIQVIDRQLVHPQTFSLIEGVVLLYRDGRFGIALLLFLFSVVFPTVKLSLLWVAFGSLQAGGESERVLGWLHRYGKYSMLDLFVVAILVVAMKGLPGGSSVEIRWGIVAFALSVLLSMLVSLSKPVSRASQAPARASAR